MHVSCIRCRQLVALLVKSIIYSYYVCILYIYRLLMYGGKVKTAACEHRILGRMVHVQVLDGVRGAHPRRGNEESDAQTVIYL